MSQIYIDILKKYITVFTRCYKTKEDAWETNVRRYFKDAYALLEYTYPDEEFDKIGLLNILVHNGSADDLS